MSNPIREDVRRWLVRAPADARHPHEIYELSTDQLAPHLIARGLAGPAAIDVPILELVRWVEDVTAGAVEIHELPF